MPDRERQVVSPTWPTGPAHVDPTGPDDGVLAAFEATTLDLIKVAGTLATRIEHGEVLHRLDQGVNRAYLRFVVGHARACVEALIDRIDQTPGYLD